MALVTTKSGQPLVGEHAQHERAATLLAGDFVRPTMPKHTINTQPYKSLGDRHRHYRSRGSHGEDARAAEDNRGHDTADRNMSWQMDSGSLLDLHIQTRGAYWFEQTSNPDQLEVCRECQAPIPLSRDSDGYVVRAAVGQRQYCGESCRLGRRNRKRRNHRARQSGRRVLSTYSASYGVPAGQASAGPQERLTAEMVTPWTVPCWAADPWLKFARSGSVPIGRGLDLSYADPVGDSASANADSRPVRRTCYGCALLRRLEIAGLNVPVGKPDLGQRTYVHNVFDAVFDGMDYYRRLVLAGKPKRDRSHSEKR